MNGSAPSRPLRILCIIVNYNGRELLRRCLERIVHRVRVPAGCTLDVLVVDNASTDGSREAIATEFPQVTVTNTGANLGGSGGFRTGLQFALDHGYDFVWLSDNDAFPSRRVLEKYVAATRQLGEDVVLGGTMYVAERPRLIHEAGAAFARNGSLTIKLELHNEPSTPTLRRTRCLTETDFLPFASIFFPVPLVRRIGLPQDLFLHYDDVEFCLRARKAGYPVLNCFDAIYWHVSGQAKPETWIRYYDVRNSLYALATGNPGVLRRQRRKWAFFAAKHVLVGRAATARLTLDGLIDNLRGVTGRVEVNQQGFDVIDVATTTVADVLAASGARHLVIDWYAFAKLLPPYQRVWHEFIARSDRPVYLCRPRKGGGWDLLRVVAVDPAGGEPSLGLRVEPVDAAAARAVARRSLFVRGNFTSVATRFRFAAFPALRWLHGSFIIDSNRMPWTDKLAILARCAQVWARV
jgi:GT2 family glycosyltransferase